MVPEPEQKICIYTKKGRLVNIIQEYKKEMGEKNYPLGYKKVHGKCFPPSQTKQFYFSNHPRNSFCFTKTLSPISTHIYWVI